MPNNKRGFGGIKFYAYADANGDAYDTIVLYDIPTSGADLPVGGVWRSGSTLKIVAPSGTELLTNAGFEAATITGWTVNSVTATLSTAADTFVEGVKSLRCVFPDSDDYVHRSVSLTAGQRYICSAWVKVTAGLAVLEVKNITSGLVMFRVVSDAIGEWIELEEEFTAPTTGSYHVRLACSVDGTDAYFDDTSLQAVVTT